MPLELYVFPASPPVVSVKLILSALNLDHTIRVLDYNNKEHHQEFYLKMNPQHTVPVVNDNDFVIWESHAINAYLVSVYGKNDDLYPRDPKKRAIVNQRLHFDNGILFPHIVSIIKPVMAKVRRNVIEEERKAVLEAYNFLEKFINSTGGQYVAGDRLTIADYSIVPNLLSLNVLVPEICNEKYPLLTEYLERCKKQMLGYDEIIGTFLEEYVNLLKKYDFNLVK